MKLKYFKILKRIIFGGKKQVNDSAKLFVNELNEKFITNLTKIRYQFDNEYGWPEFDPLRDEIAKCLICDLCQASITLTNHLLENFLKTILIYNDAIPNNENSEQLDLLSFRPSVDKFDDKDLAQTLGQAKSKGLITKDQWKLLDKYRNDFRNAYSHAEKKKIFKNKTVNTNQIKKTKNQLYLSNPAQTLLIDLPFGQGIAQVLLSKDLAFDYFISVDKIIRESLNKFEYNNAT
jgi:hypothetical protein